MCASRVKRLTVSGHGFTLVELLVVIGIIAALLAILMPALTKVRVRAQAVTCASNMRQMGMALHHFTLNHQGRFPANAYVPNSTVGWDNILNYEYFRTSSKGIRISIHNYEPGTLSCPAIRTVNAKETARRFTLNETAAGGPDPVNNPAGPYGVMVTPPNRYYDNATSYRLGAKISEFRQPSRTFLVLESDKGSDTSMSVHPHSDSRSTWYPGDGGKPWVGAKGTFAFRHPYGKSMNALFVDGHVESLRPTDPLNRKWRFQLNGK